MKHDERYKRATDPDLQIKVGQVWHVLDNDDKTVCLRRIRILAPYPDNTGSNPHEDTWIYEELPGGRMRMTIGELRRTPEFNLKYVFEVENED